MHTQKTEIENCLFFVKLIFIIKSLKVFLATSSSYIFQLLFIELIRSRDSRHFISTAAACPTSQLPQPHPQGPGNEFYPGGAPTNTKNEILPTLKIFTL